MHPGDTYTDIKRTLNLNDGTATWHLQRLEKEALVKSRTEGSRRRYYPAGVRLPDEDGGELHEIQRRLLQAVKGDPGKPVRILAEELGLSSQLTLYHLRKLASEDRVLLARRGFLLRAYSSPKATRRIP